MEDEKFLLDLRPSTFATRVKIALAEKGIKYESKQEDLSNKSPLLLEMNLIHKNIPFLIHNGKPICESLIIVQYIDEVWNQKSPLLPSDPYQGSQALFWGDYIDKKEFYVTNVEESKSIQAEESNQAQIKHQSELFNRIKSQDLRNHSSIEGEI